MALLCAAACVDDAHTRGISSRASADSWWCAHEHVHCTGFDERAHYAQWQVREKGYALGGGILGLGILMAGSRRVRVRG